MFDNIFFRLSRESIESLCSSFGSESCTFNTDNGTFYVKVVATHSQLTDATITIGSIGSEMQVNVKETGNAVKGTFFQTKSI